MDTHEILSLLDLIVSVIVLVLVVQHMRNH